MSELDLNGLAGSLAGEVITPSDGTYDEARQLWNGVTDRRPAVIARCASADDVMAAIGFARVAGLTVAVRGGGHNVAGMASVDEGLVIDLSPMRAVEVDAEAGTVRAQGGATLGDIDAATIVHGLAVPVGVVSETGIAGLTLSGGMGWLRRKYGLSCDNLISAEVVTAAGEVMTASDDEHPDLLWALRGGGGNFGVVTSFEFRAHPVSPEVAFAFALYPAEEAQVVLRSSEAAIASAPEEIAPLAFFGRVPAAEPFPEEAHGKPFVAVAAVHSGAPDVGERELRPFRELGTPLADLSDRIPYTAAQSLLDEEYPIGRRYYWKSIELDSLKDDAIAELGRQAETAPSDLSTIDVWFQGGEMSRLPADATAYGDRNAPILIGVEANWEGEGTDAANIAWARGCIEAMRPFSSGGTYLNFPGFLEEGQQQLRDAFGANYERLARVKAEYDPNNVFRVNQNIAPAPL